MMTSRIAIDAHFGSPLPAPKTAYTMSYAWKKPGETGWRNEVRHLDERPEDPYAGLPNGTYADLQLVKNS